jgi:hypothetical protein
MNTNRYIAIIDISVHAENEKQALIKSEQAAKKIGGEVTGLIFQPVGTKIAININLENLKK